MLRTASEILAQYRTLEKDFVQDPGGKRTFYNVEAMDSEALFDGKRPLIMVEGEIDLCTGKSLGFDDIVSFSDGAPPVPKGRDPQDLDPLPEDGGRRGRFECFANNQERLKKIKRFVLCVDDDPSGQRLAAEALRLLGAARCSYVTYPKDEVVPDGKGGKKRCKDINEVLMYLGAEAARALITGATRYPVRGIYTLSQYGPGRGELQVFGVGFDGWSPYMNLFAPSFIVVSGIPGHGKSSWTLNVIRNAARDHKWRSAIFSPEMAAVLQHPRRH